MPLHGGRSVTSSVSHAAALVPFAAALVAVCTVAPTAVAQHADSSVHDMSAVSQVSDTTIGPPQRFGRVPLRFVIDLGGYLPFISTHASLSSTLRNGTKVDLEDVLGLSPNTQTFNAGASWRISKHNFLAFNYFGFSRSATKTLSDSIIWGPHTYHVGSTLDVNNSIDYYGLSYRYYIWREPNWELGPGVGIDGLHVSSDMGVRVAASGTGTGVADSAKASGSITVPVPLLGIYGDWEFVPRVFVTGGFQYIYVNDIDSYGGHVGDGILGFEWYPFNHFGLGAVYHYIGADLSKISRVGNTVRFNYTIQGPALYLSATF
jgi:hypothetical protein